MAFLHGLLQRCSDLAGHLTSTTHVLVVRFSDMAARYIGARDPVPPCHRERQSPPLDSRICQRVLFSCQPRPRQPRIRPILSPQCDHGNQDGRGRRRGADAPSADRAQRQKTARGEGGSLRLGDYTEESAVAPSPHTAVKVL